MARAHSASRRPSAGPSARAKPPIARSTFPEGIIELTDSDDDQPIRPPRPKRRKFTHDASATIDLTVLSPTFSASYLRKPSTTRDEKDGKGQAEATAPPEKGKEKAFPGVINDQSSVLARPAPVVLDSDLPGMAELLKKTSDDPFDGHLSQILEVIPDVEPDHARRLLEQHYTTHGTDVVAAVLHILFEEPYPRIARNKGKRKGEESGPPAKNYGSKDRAFEGGTYYHEMAMNQLITDFPLIPVPHIRSVLQENNYFYAPTHLMLREQSKMVPAPFKWKSAPKRPSGKGKRHDPEFEKELAWLQEAILRDPNELNGQSQVTDDGGDDDNDDGDCEDGIECGCCFSRYAFDKMVQCPDTHLFCKRCMRSYVENKLVQHDPNIVCMDQSGCKLLFVHAELKRILSSKLLNWYERVKQAKEIEEAGLDGLEECPFCEYKAVIENPDEKLFRCEHEDCGAVSCRACKKLDHLPKSCREAEEDQGLNARHKVEEAMTEALMRNCPKCKKAFIKEGGCNKMTCPNCRTLSCYICRQIIKGYDHFDQRPNSQRVTRASGSEQKCLLWDPVEQRHDREVAEAREKAIKEAEAANPEVDKKQLEVEIPKTAQEANNARPGLGLWGNINLPGRAAGAVPEILHHHFHHHHQFPPPPPRPAAAALDVPLFQLLDFNFGAVPPGTRPALFLERPAEPPPQEQEAQWARQAANAGRGLLLNGQRILLQAQRQELQALEARRRFGSDLIGLQRGREVEAPHAMARSGREDGLAHLHPVSGEIQAHIDRVRGVHSTAQQPRPPPPPVFLPRGPMQVPSRDPPQPLQEPPPPYFIPPRMPAMLPVPGHVQGDQVNNRQPHVQALLYQPRPRWGGLHHQPPFPQPAQLPRFAAPLPQYAPMHNAPAARSAPAPAPTAYGPQQPR